MKISVIIPTYNEENVILDCLKSLEMQTLKGFEVIVVDDGSTDDTMSLVSSFNAKNFKLRTFSQEHRGPGMARNLGASKAKGKILMFVDSDMTFDRDFIKDLISPIIDGKTQGTFSKNEYVSNWNNRWARCWNINEGWSAKRRHKPNYPNTQKVFRAIKKSEFDRVGGFDSGGHYTDDYLSEKLGYEAVAVKGAKFYHNNPEGLLEIFDQAKWAAKREYKMGILGVIFALLRSSLPISLVIGIIKSITNLSPAFLVFKVVYDLGSFVGIIEYKLFNKQGR